MTQTIDKIVRIGTIAPWGTRYRTSVYFRIKRRGESAYTSFTGVIGPRISGNAAGGCGQIDMEFAHRNPADNDTRFSSCLIKPEDIRFAKGWDADKLLTLLDHWKRYHLKREPLPARVLDFLTGLPDADRQPAWV